MTDMGVKHNTGLRPKFVFSSPYLENIILHERTTPNYKYNYSSLPCLTLISWLIMLLVSVGLPCDRVELMW